MWRAHEGAATRGGRMRALRPPPHLERQPNLEGVDLALLHLQVTRVPYVTRGTHVTYVTYVASTSHCFTCSSVAPARIAPHETAA